MPQGRSCQTTTFAWPPWNQAKGAGPLPKRFQADRDRLFELLMTQERKQRADGAKPEIDEIIDRLVGVGHRRYETF
jgi:hypothetical protein